MKFKLNLQGIAEHAKRRDNWKKTAASKHAYRDTGCTGRPVKQIKQEANTLKFPALDAV
jgi:hypothetical protein